MPLPIGLEAGTLPRHSYNLQLTGLPAVLAIVGVVALIVAFVTRYVLANRRARAARQGQIAAEAELRALFAAMHDVVLVLDREGRYLRVPTTGAPGLYGASDELLGRTVREVLPPDAADAACATIAEALDTGQAVSTEYSLQMNGASMWFSATVSPLDLHSVVWVARDVTEQKSAREAVTRSEERYRILFDRNPCPMWVYDYDTTQIVQVNDAAVNQYGYSRDEFLQMKLQDFRAPEDAARLAAMLLELTPDEENAHMARHRTKDGRSIDVEVRAHPLGLSGRRLRLVVSADVTERLAAERIVRDAEMRAVATSHMLQSLIDATPQAMVVVDSDWKVTRWNRAAEALFGWTQEAVLGRESPIVPNDERDEVRARQRDAGVAGRQFETVRIRKDGRPVNVLVAKAPIDDSGGGRGGYIAVYADLTDRKQLEEQLRQAQKMEAIGTLAGGIAHDFNNILTVISSYSGMLLADDRYPDVHSDLEEISTAARRATGLTRQLLTFSRKAIVRLQPVDINATVSEMRPMLQRLLMENIDLVTQLGDRIALVTADPSQIEQILLNLVVNAGDAMIDGGTLVIETRNVQLDEAYPQAHADVRPGPYVLLAVSDTGIGMDAETIRKIFEPFFTTKEVGRGTGLGLATVYAIVKGLGGHIWVYSEPGHGAAFKIYLPYVPASAEPEEPTVPATLPAAQSGTVLLVEDDDAVRRATRRMLEHVGFSVLEAPDGEVGLSVASGYAGEIDVVVTDLMMPKMNGGDFARELSRTHPELRVVFMSGYTDEAVLRRGMVSAAHTFLQKPFTGDQLAQAIRQLLEGSSGT